MDGCRFPDLKEQSRSVAAEIGSGGRRSRAFAIPQSVDGVAGCAVMWVRHKGHALRENRTATHPLREAMA